MMGSPDVTMSISLYTRRKNESGEDYKMTF